MSKLTELSGHAVAEVAEVAEVASSKTKPVVVSCASEDCHSSTQAAKKLDEAGFNDVYDFEGGAKAWQKSGEPIGV